MYSNRSIIADPSGWAVKSADLQLLTCRDAGLNPAGGMDVSLVNVVCQADHLYRGILPSVVCLTECDSEASKMGRP
jgi:hypothetical protein